MTDVVVIGSGAGGLTAAVALARAGKRVLVLEQHYLPGGWCHSFVLDGFHFSPGIHYCGELGPGGWLRTLLEGLGVTRDLEWCQIDRQATDQVWTGGRHYAVPSELPAKIERLCAYFPADAKGISRVVELGVAIHREIMEGMSALQEIPWIERRGVLGATTLLRYGLWSSKSVLESLVADPAARTVLMKPAVDSVGLSPRQLPFYWLGTFFGHFAGGGWYPRGGARSIPKAFIRELKRNGGSIRVRAEVEQILVEAGRAIGVRLSDGTEIRASTVISNADAGETYEHLLDPSVVPSGVRARLAKTRWSIASLSLFLGLEGDIRAHGVGSGMMWGAPSDLDDAFLGWARAAQPIDAGPIPGYFLTFPSLKDPTMRRDGRHTAELFTFIDYAAFKRFEHARSRPPEYSVLKERYTDAMLALVEQAYPGLTDRVVFKSLGTPLTSRHYCAGTRGNSYGTEKTLLNGHPYRWSLSAPIRGLYLCGHSTLAHGLIGASSSGLAVAARILGCTSRDLLSAGGPPLRTLMSDDPDTWPATH